MASDAEVDQLRAAVSCAVVLEKRGFSLDKAESTKDSLKYRRGKGEIVIVNHEGKGWWDTGSSAKGDVFTLVQYLDPNLNFGQVRRELRALIGLTPTYEPAERSPREKGEHIPPQQRWLNQPPVEKGSRTWTYLTEQRGLPAEIVTAAAKADALRQGPYGSAWFSHRDGENAVTGFEMRGPDFRSFSRGGDKALFRLQLGQDPPVRLAVTEAPIDAMSLAVLEGMRKDTLYVATGGGMGPGTIAVLERELRALASRPGAVLVAATDADSAGERYAARLAELAAAAAVPARRVAPSGHNDWNDLLRAPAHGQPTVREAETATAGVVKAGPPAKASPAGRADPVAEVLMRMERKLDTVAGSDPRLADVMGYLIQRGGDPDRRAQARFQHNVAYALQDLEKHAGPIALSAGTRSDMVRLAGAAPGLENPRMLALMSMAASIQDGEVVREIRRVAGNVGLQADQSTPDIESRLAALEAKARLAVRPQPAPSFEAAEGAGRTAAQTPPRENCASGTGQAVTAGSDGGVPTDGQPRQIHPPRPVLDVLLSGLRVPGHSNGAPAPEQPAETPLAGRLAAFEKRTQDERDRIALRAAIRSGHAALDALHAFAEGAAVMGRIREAAKADPGGMSAVVSGMREGGRFAGLRQQFNGALETDRGLASAYDRTAAALARYDADRGAAQAIPGRRTDAGGITTRLEGMDAAISAAAAATPSRRDGRSMVDDLAGRAAGLLQRAVHAGKTSFTGSPTAASSASSASPSMGAG